MTPEELAARYEKEFPDHILVRAKSVGLPSYKVTVELAILEDKVLPFLEEFVLKALPLGYRSIEAVSDFLGVDQKYVRGTMAELMQKGFLTRDIEAKQVAGTVSLTDNGNNALRTLRTRITRPEAFTFLVDGLIEGKFEKDRRLYQGKDLRAEGIYCLPTYVPRPLEEAVDLGIVRSAWEAARRDAEVKNRCEIAAILKLDKVYTLYRLATVLVYRHGKNGELTGWLFEGERRLNDLERPVLKILQESADALDLDTFIPEVDNPSKPVTELIPQELKEAAAETTSRITELETEANTLRESLSREKDSHEAIKDPTVRAGATEKVQQLEREVAKKQQEIDALRQRSLGARTVSTHQHRQYLLRAFQEAVDRVIIVSPWLRVDAIGGEVAKAMREALAKGVVVHIVYGIAGKEATQEKELLQHEGEKLLKGIAVQHPGKLHLYNTGNTHQKILICDEKWSLVTSFNFLSFRPEAGSRSGFRQETGIYTEDGKLSRELAMLALPSHKPPPP